MGRGPEPVTVHPGSARYFRGVDRRRTDVLVNAQGPAAAMPAPSAHLSFMGTLMVAVGCGAVAQAAFVGRYTAVVFPLFILLAALGATVFADRRVLAAVLAWTTVAGLIVAIGAQSVRSAPRRGRSPASSTSRPAPNDLVLYCPDQLGPPASRLITVRCSSSPSPGAIRPSGSTGSTTARPSHATNVEQFAEQMLRLAAGHDIWFVSEPQLRRATGAQVHAVLMNWLSDQPQQPASGWRTSQGIYPENDVAHPIPR